MTDTDEVLAEQRRFYEVEAQDYDDFFTDLLDPTNAGEQAVVFRAGQARTVALLARLAPLGRTLELAGGTGVLTDLVLPHAASLTVVDGSGPSLELNRRRTAHHGRTHEVDWIEADVFAWTPSGETFDTICFSAWLHHVPDDRFEAFWASVAARLAPGGRVLFDFPTTSPAPLLDADAPPTDDYRSYQPVGGIAHRDHLGRRWRVVHVLWDEAALADRLEGLGWAMEPAGDGWFDGARWAIATRHRP